MLAVSMIAVPQFHGHFQYGLEKDEINHRLVETRTL